MPWYLVVLIALGALGLGGFLAYLWFGCLLLRAYNRGEW